MIKVYTGKKSVSVLFLFLAGAVLFLSVFFWGITKVIGLFLPYLIVLSYLMIIVFSFGFLPASIFKDLRPSICMYSVMMSHALGFSTWMLSFFFIIKALGFWWIIFALLFQFLPPIALVVAMLKGSWHIAGHLSLWISFIYGMRIYSQWLLSLNSPDHHQGNVIDVDAIEVNDHSFDPLE